MNGPAWVWFVAFIVMAALNVFLLWCNSVVRHDLRRARQARMVAEARRTTSAPRVDADALRGTILPLQRPWGDR